MSAPLVHVGYPKALSSWMQRLLFIPEKGFLAVVDPEAAQELIIEPPPFGFRSARVHEHIASRRAELDPAAELMPVITSEALVGNLACGGFNAQTNADRLFEVCPDASILIVIREQLAMIRSLYKTFVTWGMPHSLDRLLDPVEPRLAPQFSPEVLQFDLLIDHYQQRWGRDRVLVAPYEQFVEDPRQFLTVLLDHCGVADKQGVMSGLNKRKRVNANQPLADLYLQRWENYFLLSNPWNYSGMRRASEERWRKRAAHGMKNRLPGFTDSWFERGFEEKVRARCEGRFAASNGRVEELTGLDLGRLGYQIPDRHTAGTVS